MSLTLSADHRVFDGQVGGTVLIFRVVSVSAIIPFCIVLIYLFFVMHGGAGKFFTELASNFSDIRRLLL